MKQERKILPVVRKFSSFQEADDADDAYWASITEEQRLNALIDLREMFSGDSDDGNRIQKVVFKRSIYEQENN
jgi:hypothetical protein